MNLICRVVGSLLVILAASGISFSQEVAAEVRTIPQCAGQFITHELDHFTSVPGGDDVRMFEANGSGVGINDLDNDGDLDIVLANHGGLNTILWNEGRLQFRTERMPIGDSRAVNIVDIDGDGWQDIFFTRTASAPNYWRNSGDGTFEREVLPGISQPLYSTSWADLDGDGDLDLVGGTYDASLLTDFGQEFLLSGQSGVYYYENANGFFRPTRLASEAQALALVLVDLDGDLRHDILVGNDFAIPDYVWYRIGNGWEQGTAFASFSHSTMSYDFADINNDGLDEVFSTDMKPYSHDPQTTMAWQPIIQDTMDEPYDPDEPQVKENTLQIMDTSARFTNQAADRGIDASGWSWSAKFGDFDQDGYLDLYVVNGMIEHTIFSHLPDHELVEQNQVFRNDGTGHFAAMPDWGLASPESGRGMSMADLDGDGDLDIVVSNLRGYAQLFENQLCGGSSLQVDLLLPDSGNTRAIGARVLLKTNVGTYYREIRSSSGYLSGDPARLHFGFPDYAKLDRLEVHWPDYAVTTIYDPQRDSLIVVTR